MLNQSVVVTPFVSILQMMHMANGSQNFSRKTGKFSEVCAKAFRKCSVVLSRVEIRSLKVSKGQTFKIEVLFEALSVILRRWGKMDHSLV